MERGLHLGCEEVLSLENESSPVLTALPATHKSESPSEGASLLMLLSAAYEEEAEDDEGSEPPSVRQEHLAVQQKPSHGNLTPKRAVIKVDRVLRCGACEGCRRSDCGRCPNCRDKPKFGGAGVKKQACNHRRCLQPTRTGLGHREALRASAAFVAADADSDVSEAASQDSYSTVPYGSPQHLRREMSGDSSLPPVEEDGLLPVAAASAREQEFTAADMLNLSRSSPGSSPAR